MKLKLVRMIEFYIGDLLCYFLSLLKRQTSPPLSPRTIFVVRDWSLGESLLALPVLKKYKERFPECNISVFVTASSKPIFYNQPFIDEVIEFNLFNLIKLVFRRFDLGVDMMPYFRHSAILCFLTSQYVIGFDNFRIRSRLYDHKITFDDTIHMVKMFDKFYIWVEHETTRLAPLFSRTIQDSNIRSLIDSQKIKIGIHLGTESTAPWRAWHFDNFRIVMHELLNKFNNILFFLSGSSAEYNIARRMVISLNDPRVINLAGKIDLYELAYLMTKLHLYISSDTGPMHIAASMGCKTIGLFGPNTPVRFGPFPPHSNIALYNPPIGYAPTINVHKGDFGCSKYAARLAVVNRITPEMVLREIYKILIV